MTEDTLFDALLATAKEPFGGWDFGWITQAERLAMSPLPWSYASRVLAAMTAIATEGYAPNIAVAHSRLEPLGVQVFGVGEDDFHLPFPDSALDLVIDRHEAFDAAEVARVLRPGGDARHRSPDSMSTLHEPCIRVLHVPVLLTGAPRMHRS